MKFVHIADMHFDSPFINLADRPGFGDIMRMEQRKAFKKVIEYIKENQIQYLFIAGDLYEQKYIRKSTIEYINNLFKEIPNTKIFISPGNHDPYIKNSYYNQFDWNSNVKIFTNNVEKVETEEADIYGCGFDDFYCQNNMIKDLKIENKDKINILLIHGSVNASETLEKNYNPMTKKSIEEKGFDYVALGHIHKREDSTNIVYPGSTVPMGFDELGEHGIIIGELNKNKLNIQFKKISEIEFEEIKINCTEIISQEELIEKINNLKLESNKLYKIILIEKRNFEINTYNLFKFNLDEKIIKIKDKTKPVYDFNSLSNETTLKGLFTKEMLKRLDKAENEEQKSIIEKAIELGLEVLE
ncbi:MAG: DNA repair exonuclease [Clostridia bacterium]|nr:DNA repair exonuclease [Clostridia bacterium]